MYYREGDYHMEKRLDGILATAMAIIVIYGVLKLKQLQTIYDANCEPKAAK
jgi:hypothetical protein